MGLGTVTGMEAAGGAGGAGHGDRDGGGRGRGGSSVRTMVTSPGASGVLMGGPDAGELGAVRRDLGALEVEAPGGQQRARVATGGVDRDQVGPDLGRGVPAAPAGHHGAAVGGHGERLLVQRPARGRGEVARGGRLVPWGPRASRGPRPRTGPEARANRRNSAGPRSWSQYRTGTDSCRIAVTPASSRAWRRSASPSDPAPEPGPGRTGAASTTWSLAAAVSAALTPPGSAATRTASPPPAGSRHRAAWSAAFPSSEPACWPGRLEM